MYKFKITYNVSEEEWDSYLKNSNDSSFFQSANYLKIQTKNRIPIFIYIYDKCEKIKCQLGLVITKKYSPYSTKKLNRFTELISKFANRATWISGPIIFSNDYQERVKIIQTLIVKDKNNQQEISENNKIVSHIDYWDSYNNFYIKIPFFGLIFKFILSLVRKLN